MNHQPWPAVKTVAMASPCDTSITREARSRGVPFLKLRLENACGPVRCTCVKGPRQRPVACRLRPRAGPMRPRRRTMTLCSTVKSLCSRTTESTRRPLKGFWMVRRNHHIGGAESRPHDARDRGQYHVSSDGCGRENQHRPHLRAGKISKWETGQDNLTASQCQRGSPPSAE